jgi:hypothetical protein
MKPLSVGVPSLSIFTTMGPRSFRTISPPGSLTA